MKSSTTMQQWQPARAGLRLGALAAVLGSLALGAPGLLASGNPNPTYQWQKNGVNIVGATNSTYIIPGATGNDSGNYSVVATNTSGSATSNMALLTVIVPPSDAVVTITVE